jgi:hypothetical protein
MAVMVASQNKAEERKEEIMLQTFGAEFEEPSRSRNEQKQRQQMLSLTHEIRGIAVHREVSLHSGAAFSKSQHMV